MKLFALCIGATIAASLVAAEPTVEPLIDEVTVAICGDGEFDFYARGSKCSDDNDCIIKAAGEGNNNNNDGLLIKDNHGTCCGAPSSDPSSDYCDNVPEGCKNEWCGGCIFELREPVYVPPPTGCCENSCCREGYTIDKTLFKIKGLLYYPAATNNGKERLEAWQSLSLSVTDVFISPEVDYCPFPRTGELTQQMSIDITKNSSDPQDYTCIYLCCPCCNNIDISIINPETDDIPDCTGAIASYAKPANVHNFKGPAKLCANKENVLLLTHDLGIVSLDADGSALRNNRVSIGCPIKQGGGNAGYQNITSDDGRDEL